MTPLYIFVIGCCVLALGAHAYALAVARRERIAGCHHPSPELRVAQDHRGPFGLNLVCPECGWQHPLPVERTPGGWLTTEELRKLYGLS